MTKVKDRENSGVSPEAAREALIKDQQERIQAAREEINAVLEKYGCDLDIFVTLRRGSVEPGLAIVPKEIT
jgi:hypothetical protein